MSAGTLVRTAATNPKLLRRHFIVVSGCPVFSDIGPYIQMSLEDAHTSATSIYRGDDARPILNAHGKHSQFQLVHATPSQVIAWGILGTPDPVDETSHNLFSDGNPFFQVPIRGRLAWWQQGFDVPTADSDRVIAAAARHGWVVSRPYRTGSEVHHLNFEQQPKRPKVNSSDWHRLWTIRLTAPTR